MDSVAGSAPDVYQRLVLQDFNRPGLVNNLGGTTARWEADPPDPHSRLEYTLDAAQKRGEAGYALQLSYALDSDRATAIGLRTYLQKLDASAFDHLEFWIKGDSSAGFADSLKVEFRRPYPDGSGLMEKGSFVVKGINAEWQCIMVPLNFMSGIAEWKDLTEFNILIQSRRATVKKGAYYIDDIALVKTGNPGPSIRDKVIPVKKNAWEDRLGGQTAAQPHIHARLVGWPSRVVIDKRELPDEDAGFLRRLALDTWRGIDALRDREHSLPIDNIRLGKDSVAVAQSALSDYTSLTNIGLYLMAIVGAYELQFITSEQAQEKLRKTLSTLQGLETYHGFFYNYYDTTTLERTSNFISFVDSAWLSAGLMVVRMSFSALYEPATQLIEQGDYGFFYDNVEQLMSHGYYVNLPYPSEYAYGSLYTESRIGSLIAIGKGEAPEEHWFKMLRTFPPSFTWQSLKPQARRFKQVYNVEVMGGYYEWQGLKYIPSWGGSVFEALMPSLVLDEQRYAPDSLGRNNEVHTALHRRYALETLGYPVWGMSPSSTPKGDGYGEYGVKNLGVRGYPAGAVTPHAAALALAVAPQEAIANLRKLAERYDSYGEYGLYDAIDPLSGRVAHKYLALDQGMLFIALANHLKDRCVQKRFAADPIMRKALPLIGAEKFFE